jgi:hypothetical protein
MNVFECIFPKMPNNYQFDLEEEEVPNRYPLIVFGLGSSGI